MIRRSPAELYIKFLLVHPDGYEEKAIRDILCNQQLDYPGAQYTKSLRDKIRVPTPFYPLLKSHRRSSIFLMQQRLEGFFRPDSECLEAHKLLHKPRAKELIETMTMAGESASAVAHRLSFMNIHVSTLVVERYCQFYWNINLVDATELRALLRMRHQLSAKKLDDLSVDQLQQQRALDKVRYQDPRHLISEMPVTAMAGVMNQLRMGLMPAKVELARLTKVTQMAATVRAFEQMIQGGPSAAIRGRDYALVAKTMSEMLEDLGSPDAELQKELQQLKMQTDARSVPHIGELGGDFSVDMETTPKREVIDVEPE